MSAFIVESDISTAWLAAATHLLAQSGGHCANLVVTISDPTQEVPSLRKRLESFRTSEGKRGKDIPPITSVAGTIFPGGLYKPHAEAPAEHLYEMEKLIRHVVRKHKQNRRGTYFERFVAYPLADGSTINQLDRVLTKLKRAAELGHRNGNKFELAAFHPARDTNPEGFPCLSHVSITLQDARLDAAAIYRNHHFLSRAYGNYLGLGEVLRFLATESGFEVGELVCVSSHAYLEVSDHGRAKVEALIQECASTLEGGDDK